MRDQHGNRREILLGPWQSPESKAEYERVLAILKLHNGVYPFQDDATEAATISVAQVILAWWRDAEGRYGADSLELKNYKRALRPLRVLYDNHPAARFTPKCLKAVRKRMIELGWCRSAINREIVRVRAVFSWAVSEELIPPSVAHGLREVKGLVRGDRQAVESEPVKPAFWEDVAKVLPYCPPPVAAMLQLQWLTGMRSSEVRTMRTMDLDRTKPDSWQYRPGSDAGPFGKHKNAWRGQDRVVSLGPQCIALLAPWLRDDEPAAYLFSPARWMAQRNAQRIEQRKTRRQPSQALDRRRKAKPKRAPTTCYSKVSYPQAVKRACVRAGVHFHP